MKREGKVIGPYHLEKYVDKGSFGEVYVAKKKTSAGFRKTVAVKILFPNANVREVRKEIRNWQEVDQHNNVLSILNADQYDGEFVIESEYVSKGSLQDLLDNKGRLRLDEVVEITLGILEGLEHLQAKRIVHQDLKPANILMGDNGPLIADFGASRLLTSLDPGVTDRINGTPCYMAPEAFNKVRNRITDIWSVGVILYQFVSGKLPFDPTNETATSFALKVANTSPIPLTDDVPQSLQSIISKALCKNPARRYQTATEMLRALRSFQAALKGGEIPHSGELVDLYKKNILFDQESSQPRKERLIRAWASTPKDDPLIKVNGPESQPKAPEIPAKVIAEVRRVEPQTRRRLWKWVMVACSLTLVFTPIIYLWASHESYFSRGYACEQEKNYPCALENYSKEITENPEFAEAYGRRGSVYLEQADYDSAVKDCDQAIKLKADFAEAYLCRGRSYLAQDKRDEAFNDCASAIAMGANNAEAFYCRGSIYAFRNEFDRAINDYGKAIESKPGFARAYLNRGDAYSRLGDGERSLKDYSQAMKLDPGLATVYYTSGARRLQQQQYYEAIKDYDKALSLKQDYVEVYDKRAEAFTLIGNYEKAISDASEVIRLLPNEANSYMRRGDIHLQSKNSVRAIEDYSQVIVLKPNSADAHAKRADAHLINNNFNQAIGDYKTAIDMNPSQVETYFKRGDAYRRKGESEYKNPRQANIDYNQAIKDYSSAITMRSDYALAFYFRGIAFYRIRNHGKATDDYEEAIRLDHDLKSRPSPAYSEAFYLRARDFHAKGDNESVNIMSYYYAVKDYSEAIRLNGKSFNAYFQRGLIYLAEKKYDEAINDYSAAIALNPTDTGSYNNRGAAYGRKGNVELAIIDYRKAVELDRTNIVAKQNLERLERQ